MLEEPPPSPTAQDTDAVIDKVKEAAEVGKELVKETDWSAFMDDWRFKLLLALIGAWVLIWAGRKVRRAIRRRRPPKIHPLLQKYGGQPDPRQEKVAAARRKQAMHIVATSSTPAITGYELVEQIEAVYVDGFRSPEEALEGLKSAAAMKGANAVANVRQERNASGSCSAQGDAVVVTRINEANGTPAPADDEQNAAQDDVQHSQERETE